MDLTNEQSELLSPAGDFETALAAFAAGADAVYCGLADFSARAFAKNLSFDDLEHLVAYAHAHARKVYVTFNTLLDQDALESAAETLARLDDIGPDALIVQDLGVARLVRHHFPHLALHASTQLVAHNLEGVLALGELGFTRVVLARELSLDEIASIARRCGAIELEVFIHGALCYSLSGLCLFGAMEKDRSGNRGQCPYCCRQGYAGDKRVFPFSMKDLRVGEDAPRLVRAGVASLKIEGRMKSPLYVASVTRYYREILDGVPGRDRVTTADLETVFSRRTTKLYLDGRAETEVIDPSALGHLGTPIGSVKKVTRDREGRAWLRFHTARALEKHDGLQFEATDENGKHLGMGIAEMRPAISRHPVFEVAAGTDVEIALSDDIAEGLKSGMAIYCSMSNAVKRRFPVPSYRPSDSAGTRTIDLAVTLSPAGISVEAKRGDDVLVASVATPLTPARDPSRTSDALRKAFAKLGGTGYCLGRLTVNDPDHLFAPMSVLNDLRRDLVERLDDRRADERAAKTEAARAEIDAEPHGRDVPGAAATVRRLKLRPDQKLPAGVWDETIVCITAETTADDLTAFPSPRLALPVYTAEPDFNRLRTAVKRLLRAGFVRWEASDLATLRLLRTLGVTDITADWTLYAFNAPALATLADLGVARVVASPENSRENLQYLAESGYAVECLVQQSTPLFMSLTKPATTTPDERLRVFRRDGLWITTKSAPRTWTAPSGAAERLDLSWDPAS